MNLNALITFPFKRKQYAGINNPRFVGDVVASNEAVLDGLQAITGLGNTDFAIITGLDYSIGSLSYSGGIFFLNGNFYVIQNGFIEGNYLTASPTDFMPQAFQDGVSRPIYTVQFGATSNVSAGNSPLFTGNMNAYRIGLKYTQSAVIALQTIAAALGNSSTRNVGTIAGTVATGDDSRLVYTQAQFNTIFATFALWSNVLALNNTTAYLPAADYHPATKKYVDDSISAFPIVHAASFHVGDVGVAPYAIDNSSSLFTISIPVQTNSKYIVSGSLVGLSSSALTDKDVFWTINGKSASSFNLIVRELNNANQNLQFDFTITKMPN